MSATALDTSVIVAALLGWHEAHAGAARAVIEALDGECIVPQSVLIESYAVLTRLPARYRLRPADAFELLEGSFRDGARVVSLRPSATWSLLSEARETNVAGGLTYDARILAEARAGAARSLLTLNPRHFERLATGGFEIVDPTLVEGAEG